MQNKNSNGHEELMTKRMLNTPITPTSKLIGQKWFLPLEVLSDKTGVPYGALCSAIRGKKIYPKYEIQIEKYLSKL